MARRLAKEEGLGSSLAALPLLWQRRRLSVIPCRLPRPLAAVLGGDRRGGAFRGDQGKDDDCMKLVIDREKEEARWGDETRRDETQRMSVEGCSASTEKGKRALRGDLDAVDFREIDVLPLRLVFACQKDTVAEQYGQIEDARGGVGA